MNRKFEREIYKRIKRKPSEMFIQVFILAISIVAIIIMLFAVNSLFNASWFIGHDNGEAYEVYTESMREYMEE